LNVGSISIEFGNKGLNVANGDAFDQQGIHVGGNQYVDLRLGASAPVKISQAFLHKGFFTALSCIRSGSLYESRGEITRSRAMERTDRIVEGQKALSCIRSGSLTRTRDSYSEPERKRDMSVLQCSGPCAPSPGTS
jgi:hypothetical protein